MWTRGALSTIVQSAFALVSCLRASFLRTADVSGGLLSCKFSLDDDDCAMLVNPLARKQVIFRKPSAHALAFNSQYMMDRHLR